MIDSKGLEHDICFVMSVIDGANQAIKTATDQLIQIKNELASVKLAEPEPPAWKPEDLIGKLVRAWDVDKATWSPQRYDEYLRSNPKYPYRCGSVNWKNIEPLTEAEALALVWRQKPRTRYDWSHKDIPAWGKWIARDEDGYPFAYASKPEVRSKTLWSNTSDSWQHIPKSCILDASGDWRDSLERRPE
jgi:hypothetical protein